MWKTMPFVAVSLLLKRTMREKLEEPITEKSYKT